MDGLLHLVQPGAAWAGCGPAHSPHRCTKCNSPPINGQCTNLILVDVAQYNCLCTVNRFYIFYSDFMENKYDDNNDMSPFAGHFWMQKCSNHWNMSPFTKVIIEIKASSLYCWRCVILLWCLRYRGHSTCNITAWSACWLRVTLSTGLVILSRSDTYITERLQSI